MEVIGTRNTAKTESPLVPLLARDDRTGGYFLRCLLTIYARRLSFNELQTPTCAHPPNDSWRPTPPRPRCAPPIRGFRTFPPATAPHARPGHAPPPTRTSDRTPRSAARPRARSSCRGSARRDTPPPPAPPPRPDCAPCPSPAPPLPPPCPRTPASPAPARVAAAPPAALRARETRRCAAWPAR